MKRVVITGLGMVAPTGDTINNAWNAALECKSAVGKITLFDASALKVQIAAEVKNFDCTSVVGAKDARRMTRFIQFAAVAANQAIEDAGLDNTSGDRGRYGCAIGVGMGGLSLIEESSQMLREKGERRVSPFVIPYIIPNMAAGYVSIKFDLKGPNICHTTACSSGTHSIGESFRLIQEGRADVMVCGGSESTISPLGIASFTACKALSSNNAEPELASRPFDKDRDGFVMGEGAGIMVLEELEHARKRGADIYAEVVGYGLSGDAYHITAPPCGGEGGARAMKGALENAKLNADDVDYINAHGTSTSLNDQYESEAIQSVFKEHAKNLSISSTKAVTGHCIGAAGGIEAIYTTLAIRNAVVPPTANLRHVDPSLPALDFTPNQPKSRPIRSALSNSFGFGGTNATIALKRFS